MDDPLSGGAFAHSGFSVDPYSQGTYVETNGQPAMSGPHLVTQGAAPAPDLENDKRTIYRHPLFPLLLMLFEKCELATQTTECPSARSIDMDIRAFVSQMQHQGKALLADEPEIDSLIVKAVEVLRMHLLELEKVGDLCKDFCQRYIACLKGKMQSDNILKAVPDQAFATPPEQPTPPGAAFGASARGLPPARDVGMGSSQGALSSLSAQLGDSQGILSFEQQGTSSSADSTPSTSTSGQAGSLSAAGDIQHVGLSRKGRRRGVLPKNATSVLRSWLFQHLVHPYPTEDEKRQLAVQTQLTILQVNNWFINARRRILQPMLDNTAGNGNSRKSPATRYPPHMWLSSISDVQPTVSSPCFDGDDMGAAGVPVLAAMPLNSEPLLHPVTDMPMRGNFHSLPPAPHTPIDQSVPNFMPESPLPDAAGFPIAPSSMMRTSCEMSYSNHGVTMKPSSTSVDGHYNMMNTVPLQHPPNDHDDSQCGYQYREESSVEREYRSPIRLMPTPRPRDKQPGRMLNAVPQEARGGAVSQAAIN